jgi:hypothetical protein
VLVDDPQLDALLDHLQRSTPLRRDEARRVVEDVLAAYGEDVEGFVRRRHRELKRAGLRNPEAFTRIGDELQERRVAPPKLTERQVRRVIYG